MRLNVVGFGIVALLALSSFAHAGEPQRRSPAAHAAPRTIEGNMRGNVVAVRSDRDRPIFEYVLTGARITNGKLELVGTLRASGGRSGVTAPGTATLVGSLAKEISPEYVAARSRRNAARSGAQRPATGVQTEQKAGGPATNTESAGELGQLSQSTQSTSRTTPPSAGAEGEKPEAAKDVKAAATGIGGCDVVFFRMELPTRYAAAAGSRNVQLNVSLAQIDNQQGVSINQRICRVVNAIEANRGAAEAEAAELNRLLGGM